LDRPQLIITTPHHLKPRHWAHTALIAWTVILLYALGFEGDFNAGSVIRERLVDVLIGCAIAVVGGLPGPKSRE
jgi:hypothetical protein